jgi:alkylhydroperoxidase family enzyme
MSHPRIVPLEAPFDGELAATFAKYLPPGLQTLNLFRTQAHNPRVLQRMLAGNLLDEGAVDRRTRELVILRTCARCGSEYEWGVHVALFAKGAPLSEADVAATLAHDLDDVDMAAADLLLLRAVDALHDTSTMNDALWTQLTLHYAHAQILEIIALVGNYHAISFLTNAARVEREGFAPRFPSPEPACA